jgi:uncharacterized protein
MNRINNSFYRRFITTVLLMFILALTATPAISGEYAALDGVKRLRVVFDVSQGSPQIANTVFWAVRNVYQDKAVRTLPKPPIVAVVFHGPAVKLISTDREGFKDSDNKALDEFANTIREMKKDGVKLEVCLYALKVLDIDPATILPEVEHVGNGFISVAGYQAQGFSLVTIN